MSDNSSAVIAEARRDWKTDHLGMYLDSGGAEGHIVDVSDIGGHKFTTTLLLKYVGRKSGKTMITPLIYGDIDGEVVIVASKGGADHHPAWYLNIRESKELEFQIATQAFRATWREPAETERQKIWDFMEGVFPPYKGYQAFTERQIPLVMLSAIGTVERFGS
ncbi:nitroreductase/quinone reductase family protein [Sphingomonas cavernae]|uniref:Nitroreductase family deazaflavin-dependent oxidoreductase n=1 Tax=Sphingomonas cavernae TaxID=2320861 RepID=A0A418WMB8_9SPHN|nr:nitroreductase/quinone reductase family protein [Sphingomonas cavernae]RJF91154.1 nitroreductase family deazaflavin-dependent oxidoreductase [Sphingomonas cavernae]